MRSRILVALGVGLAATGCASGGTGLEAKPLPTAVRATMANVITAEEIARQQFTNALQAVVALRPTWQRGCGGGGSDVSGSGTQSCNVYLDDKPLGGFESLQGIPIETVQEMRLLSREQARVRWDVNAQASILVLRKKK